MELSKTVIILGIIISLFIFAVSFATLYTQTHILEGNVCSCTLPIPLLIPTFSSFGLLIGLITYYLISPIVVRRCSRSNYSLFLELLDPAEREVIKLLAENRGIITQALLTKKFGKLKAFRVVEKLVKRGIVKKIKDRKTNRIVLSEKFSELFK